ncbi:MAG: hypothetical protein M9894_16020 [Planctomycetes bacterium]|nr:hypothetical protein [Planctomycetota bacterium]
MGAELKDEPLEVTDAMLARRVDGYLARQRRRTGIGIRAVAMRMASVSTFLLREAEAKIEWLLELVAQPEPDRAEVDELAELLEDVKDSLDKLIGACEQTDLLHLVPPGLIDLEALRRARARGANALALTTGLRDVEPTAKDLAETKALEAELRAAWKA